MWDEPPFYQVFDAVLDNEGDAVFLVNGGDGELIRYDIGTGRTSRIGRRGSGPGKFRRPVWLEPHGPDSLLAYDVSLGRFSVLSRSGDLGPAPGYSPLAHLRFPQLPCSHIYPLTMQVQTDLRAARRDQKLRQRRRYRYVQPTK